MYIHDLCKFNPSQNIVTIEDNRLVFEEGDTTFDLLVGVPAYAAPQVVKEAGLTDNTGWIPVDLQTLETNYRNIFAIGDITAIRQPNFTGLFLPKSWVFAEEQGRLVARNLALKILGDEKSPSDKFNGKSFCYIEVGNEWFCGFLLLLRAPHTPGSGFKSALQ